MSRDVYPFCPACRNMIVKPWHVELVLAIKRNLACLPTLSPVERALLKAADERVVEVLTTVERAKARANDLAAPDSLDRAIGSISTMRTRITRAGPATPKRGGR